MPVVNARGIPTGWNDSAILKYPAPLAFISGVFVQDALADAA